MDVFRAAASAGQAPLQGAVPRGTGTPPDRRPFNAAGRMRPSGTRRPSARTGGLRVWPRRPATGRAACRRRQTPCRRWCGSRRCWRARCRARVAVHAKRVEHRGHRRDKAHGQQDEVGRDLEFRVFESSRIFIWPVASSLNHSTRTPTSFSTWPSLPTSALVATDQSRSQPSSCEDDVRSPERPVGPDHGLVLAFGRLGQQFELRDRGRAVAVAGSDAVRAGVAAADHDHVLALWPASGRSGDRRRPPCSAGAGSPWRSTRRTARAPAPAGRAGSPSRRS